jgi:hypothetical protein
VIRELMITGKGIEVGEPLRGFQGLLTGNPSALGVGGGDGLTSRDAARPA